MILAGVAAPHQHLVDHLAFLGRRFHGLVRLFLVIQERAAAVITVHRHQHPAAGIGDPLAARLAAETTEHHGMNGPQPGARQHGDRQFRHHWHVDGHSVACLDASKIPQHGGKLVHPRVKFLICDCNVSFIFRFRHVKNGCFVSILCQVAINTIVGNIKLATNKPLPAWGITGIQQGMPIRIPIEEVSVFFETLGKSVKPKATVNVRVGHIRLRNELRRWLNIRLLLPMHGDLRFTRRHNFRFAHLAPL